MKGLEFNQSPGVYIEITQTALRALNGSEGLELPLERAPDGRLAQTSRAQAIAALQKLANRPSWQSRLPAYCAIPARGISIRHLILPPASKEEFQRVLLLQIENEFPIPPEELAWGYQTLGVKDARKSEVLVAAVKKEWIEEYSDIITQAGMIPSLVSAPLARAGLCPAAGGSYGLIDIGDVCSEAITFSNGVPKSQRSVPWGEIHLSGAVQDALNLSRPEAEQACLEWYADGFVGSERGAKIDEAFAKSAAPLADALGGGWNSLTVYITGKPAAGRKFPGALAAMLGQGVQCERIESGALPGRSAAILGLQAIVGSRGPQALLAFQSKQQEASASAVSKYAPTKWMAIAAGLAVACLAFPYVEAAVMKPFVAKKLQSVQARKGRLGIIDRELEFLQYIKDNQPPYLEALYLFANSGQGGGWKMDSITMNRRGEVSLGGSVRDAQQVGSFRTKLIDSGFFSSVVVEEQTPSPDRQKITVRMSAQWKAPSDRELLNLGPVLPDPSKSGSNAPPGAVQASGSTNAPAKTESTNQPSKEPIHAETKR